MPENWTISNLLKNHASRPYNPDIANTLFRSGYIESWGRGIAKMAEFCLAAGIPKPNYVNDDSDFWVEFRKDIYNEEYLTNLGLNERQVKAVLLTKEKGKITNSDYQGLNEVSKSTATRDLSELVDKKMIRLEGSGKRDIHYTLNQK